MTKPMTVGLSLLALVVTFGVTPAGAQTTAAANEEMRGRVVQELSKHDALDNVTVDVDGAAITLRGQVPSLWAKEEALRRALDVEGIHSVANELAIMRADSDEAIAEEAIRRIQRYVFFTIFDDVNVAVEDGTVTLTGAVSEPYRKGELGGIVSRVRGVQALRNELETLPASISDDQLRVTLTREIYSHDLFRRYAVRRVPPIHIIVRASNVTLTGAVASNVERQVAEAIVRSTFGVLSVNNELRISS